MVFTFIKYSVLFIFIIFLAGCTTISEKLDVAGIIDKTETLIFGDKDNNEKKELEKTNIQSDTGSNQESYPDISEVPQDRPDIPEIDKSFFEGEVQEDKQEINQIILSNNDNTELSDTNISFEIDESDPEIRAIFQITKKMRVMVRNLLANSDPPTDMNAKNISEIKIKENNTQLYEENKLAIIQFPNNSFIPDSSAQTVINEIYRLYKNSKLMLIGHSSSLGSDTSIGKKINMEISFARAETIKKMLIEIGFLNNNIIIEGRGDLEPLQKQEDSEIYREAANRRVEIFFITE
jgi:outer membrane protein OmpA-like peptidoglycan-associated protein